MAKLRARRARFGVMFWLEWIAASIVGLAVGWALFDPVYGNLTVVVGGANQGAGFRAVSGSLTWMVVWSVVGLAQTLVLRGIVRRAWLWLPGAALGGLCCGAFAEQVFAAQIGADVGLFGGFVGGFAAGVVQWFGLRWISRWALLWPLASALAWMAGMSLGMLALQAVLQAFGAGANLQQAWAICGAICGALLGAITGALLLRVFRRPRAV